MLTDKTIYRVTVSEPSQRAVELLSAKSGLTKARIKQCMQQGAIWLKRQRTVRRIRRAKKKLAIGDELFFYYCPSILAQKPTPAELIADHGAWSVWFKPAGMFSQGSKWGDHCTLARYVEQHLKPERNVYPVHRLDRATSGIMLLAHTKTTASDLVRQFEARKIDKYYQAQVAGDYSQLLASGPQTIDQELDGKAAVTRILSVSYDDKADISWLAIQLLTGRKHQIRRHLSAQGFPVIGDTLYGNAESGVDLKLQSTGLSLICPVTFDRKHFRLQASQEVSNERSRPD